jgi:hypothetical protein
VKDQSTQIRTSDAESPWQKTSYANLILYASSGCYFARIKIGGKLIRQSLNESPHRGELFMPRWLIINSKQSTRFSTAMAE